MSLGSTAYASYRRIHTEMGKPNIPGWEDIPHLRRIAWEAAAQAVAKSVLPSSLNQDSLEDHDDES